MGYENIRVDREDPLAVVAVARPDKLNALNDATLVELTAAFRELGEQDAVRCVILTGGDAKKPSFVAGADIAELAEQDGLQAKRRSQLGRGAGPRN